MSAPVSGAINFQTTNPAQLIDRVTELQTAVVADESAAITTEYTSAGAISFPGRALLKTGTSGAFTLAQPSPGANPTGQDGAQLEIIALDAEAYTVTTAANGINGADDTMTASAAIGDTVKLIAFNGVWYVRKTTTGTPAWALTEV